MSPLQLELVTWLVCFPEDMHFQKPHFKALSALPPNESLKETEKWSFKAILRELALDLQPLSYELG